MPSFVDKLIVFPDTLYLFLYTYSYQRGLYLSLIKYILDKYTTRTLPDLDVLKIKSDEWIEILANNNWRFTDHQMTDLLMVRRININCIRNAIDTNGNTLLMIAIKINAELLFSYLLTNMSRSYITQLNDSHCDALYIARYYGKIDFATRIENHLAQTDKN
jgi:hypothetical protein